MQVLSATSPQNISFASITRELVEREGVRALWSGLPARLVVLGPGAALTWAIYENIKFRLGAKE